MGGFQGGGRGRATGQGIGQAGGVASGCLGTCTAGTGHGIGCLIGGTDRHTGGSGHTGFRRCGLTGCCHRRARAASGCQLTGQSLYRSTGGIRQACLQGLIAGIATGQGTHHVGSHRGCRLGGNHRLLCRCLLGLDPGLCQRCPTRQPADQSLTTSQRSRTHLSPTARQGTEGRIGRYRHGRHLINRRLRGTHDCRR